MNPKTVTLLMAFYRGLLRAFPAAFRAEFEDEMVDVLRQRLEHTAIEGVAAMFALLLREAGGLVGGGLHRRLYARPEQTALLAVAGEADVPVESRRSRASCLGYAIALLALLFLTGIAGIFTGLIPFPLGNEGTTQTFVAALADFDGDGNLDLVAGNDQHLGPVPDPIWWNDGQGNFPAPPQLLNEPIPGSYNITTGDFNGDGRLDILFGIFGSGRLILSEGERRFALMGTQLQAHDLTIGPVNVAPGDLDGDGDLDAIIAACCGTVVHSGVDTLTYYPPAHRVFLNDGAGNLSPLPGSLGDLGTRSVALGDLDGDGDLDAYFGNSFSTRDANNTMSRDEPDTVWINDGAGRFTDSGQRLGDRGTTAVALGDLDGDGDLDAFTGHDGPGEVWLNDGAATFSDSGQRLGDDFTRFVFLVDVDGDGDLDALVEASRARGRVQLWLNDGSGGFEEGRGISFPADCAAAPGDVDGDGDTDVAAACVEREVIVWLNDGSGNLRRR